MPRPTVYVAMQETAVERGRIDALLMRMRVLEDRIAVLEAKPATTMVRSTTPVRSVYTPTPEQEARRAAFAAAREAAIAEAKRTGRPTAVIRPEGY